MKLKKHALVDEVATATGLTRIKVREVLQVVADAAHEAIAERRDVFLFGLGKLSVTQRGARRARHMVTGAPVVVPPCAVVLFRPSESLKAAANADS